MLLLARQCVVIGLLLACGPAWADERRDQEARLEVLRERIQALTAEMEDTRGRRDGVKAQLARLERDLGRVHKQLRVTEFRLDDARRRLRTLERRAAEQKAGLTRERRVLAGRLRSAYAEGRRPLVKLILNQEDPDRIGRLVGYHAYIQRDRIRRVEAIRDHLDRMLSLRADIRRQTARLEALIEEQRLQRERVKIGAAERETVLATLEEALHSQDERIARLRADEQALEKLITRISDVLGDIPEDLGKDESILARRGKLAWPVKGRLQRRFGAARMGDGRPSRGVLIRAGEGDEVRVVARGRVVFADWLNGVGMLLVVKHTDGFLSLYGHNRSLYKEVGEWVEAGEPVAAVGHTGGRTRPALYFEIRRGGASVDPADWCRKPRGRQVG